MSITTRYSSLALRALSDVVSPSPVVNFMQKVRILALLAAIGLVISCDAPTQVRTGSIRIALLTEGGTPALIDARKGDLTQTPDMRAAPTSPNVLIDAVQVRVVGGAVDRTVTSSTPTGGNFLITIADLPAGSYTVTVTGLVGGLVAHLGETAGVVVTAGQTQQAAVTFPVFQPAIPDQTVVDTSDVLSFDVAYGAVTGATSYRIEWDQNPSFTAPLTKDTTGLGARIAVTAEGNYYVRVRALRAALVGLPTPTKGVYIFQGVSTVTVTPASPTILAGATQQLTGVALDAANAVVTGFTWYWASSNQSVALVSSTGLVTGVSGGTVTITGIAKGTPGSAAVAVTARPAAKLSFTSQPGNAVAGATIPTVRVAIQDATGATVTSDNTTQVSIAIGTNAGPGGALDGLATVSAVAGIATFSALDIDEAGAGYTLVTTATGLTGVTSAIFNIAAGPATQLAFTVEPSATAANAAMSPAVQVTVRDAIGNRVESATNAVTIAIGTNPGTGILAGTKVVNAVSGVASFSGLSLDQVGTGYTLTANATGLTLATSGAFDVTAALPASVLVFSVQPASGQAGDPLSPAVQVEVRNANGERVTTARDAVTLNFQANPGSGTISGTKIVNAIDGIASFTGLAINKAANGYTFAATSGSLTAATSNAFNITPGAPTRVRFLTQPANAKGNVAQGSAITVAIADAFDNTVTSATANVTLALGANPWRSIFATTGGGAVSATSLTVAAVAGVATFANVRVDKPGIGYTLAATSSGITSAASTAFNINVTFSGAISGGSAHTCAISLESGAYCWGANGSGQLGSTTGSTFGDSIPSLVTGGFAFASITSGGNHTCGLIASGAAYCWGNNGSGQLGNNTTVAQAAPVAVSGGLVFMTIDAGGSTTCGLTTTSSGTAALDQQVYCWGYGGNGQLGNALFANSSIPVRVAEPLQTTTRAISVSVGQDHACAVAANALAYCWGYNGYGQLGTAVANYVSTNVPTQVHAAGTYTWTSIASGNYHTCGISSNGGNIARCWGYGYSGALGDNLAVTSPIPVTVAGNLTNWTRITVGNQFSCASTPAFTQCWGQNGSGQLGSDEQIGRSDVPVLVVGSMIFTALDAGQDHVCGKTGTVASSVMYCWGYNGNGRLGSTGVNTAKRSPTLVVQ